MSLLQLFIALLLYLPYESDCFLAHNIFETGDPRLFPLFCVETPEALDHLATNTSTQQSIIEAAVKRSVSRFLSAKHQQPAPPDPSALSLSQLYQTFLGNCSSPDRFILAVNSLVDSAAKLDILPGIKNDPKFHFDAEAILEGQNTLVERQGLLVTTIMTEAKFPAARELLGRSLHSIAVFYAHTNWVELGHTVPLAGLGMPGGRLPELAPPDAPPCSSSNLTTTGLTSGFLPEQPNGEARCRHGSSQDDPALGGINKDTGSSCWSQHAQHHEMAANIATSAVENYLDNLRFIIDDHNFGNLFELSQGSALVIAIDCSSSMTDEINAVKLKVSEIVETALETGLSISRYVLVPFGSPPVPEPTVTSDPKEYLDAVMKLSDNMGGNEQFWTAVQLGLTNAPPYSDIIVFTDEPGDDGQLKDGVIGLAEGLSSQVSVIYSGGSFPSDHLDLCEATGGLCIQLNKVDASDIVQLLSSSIEESKAVIGQFRNLTGFHALSVQLDNSLVMEQESWTEVKISGQMTQMMLQHESLMVDLADDASMAASGLQINVTVRTNDLLFFKFRPNSPGMWQFFLNSVSTYSTTVTASCTFSFLGTFRYLDMATNHPNLHKLPGRPVRHSSPTILLTLTGHYKDNIQALKTVSFVDQTGFAIESHTVHEPFLGQEDIIVQTSYSSGGLTHLPFYVRLEGEGAAGESFHRLLPTLVTPVSTQVEVTSSSSIIEVAPCNQTTVLFLVSDFGEPTDVSISINDDKGFLVDFSPKTVYLETNASQTINATFSVPCDARVGSLSTITVTATSALDLTSNSVSEFLHVITGQSDTQPPVCRLEVREGGPCQGTPPHLCHTEDWLLAASVQDTNSGLGRIRVNSGQGSLGNLSAEFEAGTTDPVEVEYSTTCCNSNVSLTVFDILGNWETGCREEFTMRNCSLVNVKEVGSDWIYFEWSRPCDVEDSVEVDYMFTMTNLYTMDTGLEHHTESCDTWWCHDNFTYASPCTDYQLDLNASFLDPTEGVKTEGYRIRRATTQEEVSSSPMFFNSTSETTTSVTLEWLPPAFHNSCLSHYLVCFHEVPSRASTCLSTNTTSLMVTDLQPCTTYHFQLSAVTSGGLESPHVILEVATLPDHPGPVEDLKVVSTGENFITLEWDTPTLNPACLQGYDGKCYINDRKRRGFTGSIQSFSSSSNNLTITVPYACTDYLCEVMAMGNDHWESPPQTVAAHTDISGLSPPVAFTADYVGTRDVVLSWLCPSQGCQCVTQFVLLWAATETQDEGQVTVDGHELEAVLAGLLPCTTYSVSIQGVTQEEMFGEAANLELTTKEVAPGKVTSLSPVTVTQDSFEVRWQEPAQDPQCVASFETSLENCGGGRWEGAGGRSSWTYHTEGNLTCDTCYGLTVTGVSSSGLQGQPATIDIWTRECPPV